MKNLILLGMVLFVSTASSITAMANGTPNVCDVKIQLKNGAHAKDFDFLTEVTLSNGSRIRPMPGSVTHGNILHYHIRHFIYNVDVATCAGLRDWLRTTYKSKYNQLTVSYNGVASN